MQCRKNNLLSDRTRLFIWRQKYFADIATGSSIKSHDVDDKTDKNDLSENEEFENCTAFTHSYCYTMQLYILGLCLLFGRFHPIWCGLLG